MSNPRNPWTTPAIAIALVVLPLGLAGCAAPNAVEAPASTTAPPMTTAAPPATTTTTTPPASSGGGASLTLQSSPDQSLTWTGGQGAPPGKNPQLAGKVGQVLQFTITDADGIAHNFGIKDSAGKLVSPPGWSADVENNGDAVTVRWTPGAAGTYTYLCKYHASTMKGTLEVTAA